jgi:RNA polymerase sigma-70 factor (ECF subfamily)
MKSQSNLPAAEAIPTRYSLLSRLQDWGDQESWRDFFDTYWRLIYTVALKSGLTESESQDVVQETVICVAKDIQKFKRDRTLGTFKAWLWNITRWRIADQLKKRQPAEHLPSSGRSRSHSTESEPEEDDSEEIAEPDSSGIAALWEEEWKSNLFKAALTRVKRSVREEHYQIFDLYVLKEWPATKVARVLGVSLGQVYIAKHRVASMVRKELKALETKY